jgi:hypothetical protein
MMSDIDLAAYNELRVLEEEALAGLKDKITEDPCDPACTAAAAREWMDRREAVDVWLNVTNKRAMIGRLQTIVTPLTKKWMKPEYIRRLRLFLPPSLMVNTIMLLSVAQVLHGMLCGKPSAAFRGLTASLTRKKSTKTKCPALSPEHLWRTVCVCLVFSMFPRTVPWTHVKCPDVFLLFCCCTLKRLDRNWQRPLHALQAWTSTRLTMRLLLVPMGTGPKMDT